MVVDLKSQYCSIDALRIPSTLQSFNSQLALSSFFKAVLPLQNNSLLQMTN